MPGHGYCSRTSPASIWDGYFGEVNLEPLTPRTPTTKTGNVALLEEARYHGYAISDEDVTVGVTSVGAPIFDHKGQVHAAISVGGSSRRRTR